MLVLAMLTAGSLFPQKLCTVSKSFYAVSDESIPKAQCLRNSKAIMKCPMTDFSSCSARGSLMNSSSCSIHRLNGICDRGHHFSLPWFLWTLKERFRLSSACIFLVCIIGPPSLLLCMFKLWQNPSWNFKITKRSPLCHLLHHDSLTNEITNNDVFELETCLSEALLFCSFGPFTKLMLHLKV